MTFRSHIIVNERSLVKYSINLYISGSAGAKEVTIAPVSMYLADMCRTCAAFTIWVSTPQGSTMSLNISLSTLPLKGIRLEAALQLQHLAVFAGHVHCGAVGLYLDVQYGVPVYAYTLLTRIAMY